MSLSNALLAGLLAASVRLAAGLLSANQVAGCDCFSTQGSIDAYWTNYASYDFRQLSQYAGVPALITDSASSTSAPVTSDFFNAANWTNNWAIQTWDNGFNSGKNGGDATLQMTNSANNIYIEKNTDANPGSDTFLTLRSARLPDFQTVAEFDAADYRFQFLSTRMYARVIGDAGTCASMFVYQSDTQEADIEFLTKDPKNVGQYTNQPGSTPGATSNATLPVSIDQWAVHRYDWTLGTSTWYVNDEQVAQIQVNTPHVPLMVIFNNWSNGNGWTGVMQVGDAAYLQIQWIEIAYNTTTTGGNQGPANRLVRRANPGPTCSNVCNVDSAAPAAKPPPPTNSPPPTAPQPSSTFSSARPAATVAASPTAPSAASCTAGGIVFDINVHDQNQQPLARRSQTSAAVGALALSKAGMVGAVIAVAVWVCSML